MIFTVAALVHFIQLLSFSVAFSVTVASTQQRRSLKLLANRNESERFASTSQDQWVCVDSELAQLTHANCCER